MGGAPLRISGGKRDICRQRLPLREHHCVITFTDAGFTLRKGKPPPCPPDSCRINLVASASNPSAGVGDLLMVGGQRPDGSIPQDPGRINAIRFHPGDQPTITGQTSGEPVHRRVDPDFRKHVVYSKQLNELEAGEQLEVSGKLRTKIGGLPYNVRTSAQLVLTARSKATHANDAVRRAATLGGQIDELNGFKLHPQPAELRDQEGRAWCRSSGTSISRCYVNLVTIARGPKKTRPGPGRSGQDRRWRARAGRPLPAAAARVAPCDPDWMGRYGALHGRQRRAARAREARDRAHGDENRHEYDATIETFDHPRYELIGTGDVYDGPEEVARYFEETRTAFPDQRNELIALHHADEAVIVEANLYGTHDGPFRGLPPTGRKFEMRFCACSCSRRTGWSASASTSTPTRCCASSASPATHSRSEAGWRR